MKYLNDRFKEAKDHNRNQTGGDRKTSPFYEERHEEIDSVLGCRDIVTFSHVEESSPSASSSSLQGYEQKDDEQRDLDDEFEKSLAVFGLNRKRDLAVFGLNRKRERKSQRRDERKYAKTAKPSGKERDDDDEVFQESMEKLQRLSYRNLSCSPCRILFHI